jgi:hypothetical protein
MPVIEDDAPGALPSKNPSPVQIAAPEYKGITVDTRYTPARALLTHIEGMAWTVNYYSQVLGKDNALSSQNVDRSAVFQGYKRVIALELKVTTALNTVQDQQTKNFSVTGQANLIPCGLIPNEGDCFIADVGDGREAVFEITNSEKRSIYKDGAYVVDYKLLDYSEQDARIADLTIKTVEELQFDRASLEAGQKGLIHSTDFAITQKLRAYYAEMSDFYFSRFYSNKRATLLLPAQNAEIYDPFLTSAVLRMFRDEPHENIRRIRELNVFEDDNYDTPTVWTALRNKRRKELIGGMQRVGLVATKHFSPNPKLNSVRYSGVQYVVYPVDPNKSEDYQRRDLTKPMAVESIQLSPTRIVSLTDLIQVTELNGLPSFDAQAILPSQKGTYIFSPAFYDQAYDSQSALELAFNAYLDDKAYNMKLLRELCVSYTSWAPLEQFYQMPFLIAIVRSAIGRL